MLAGALSARTATRLAWPSIPGFSARRAIRSASANRILGWESSRPKAISAAVHQAFMPTAATPMQAAAQ